MRKATHRVKAGAASEELANHFTAQITNTPLFLPSAPKRFPPVSAVGQLLQENKAVESHQTSTMRFPKQVFCNLKKKYVCHLKGQGKRLTYMHINVQHAAFKHQQNWLLCLTQAEKRHFLSNWPLTVLKSQLLSPPS